MLIRREPLLRRTAALSRAAADEFLRTLGRFLEERLVGLGDDADVGSHRVGDLGDEFGDVLGTALYDKYGNFFICVIAVTVVYALILPMLLLVPKQLTSTSDGQKP